MARLCLVAAVMSSACLTFHDGALPGEPEDATFESARGVRVRFLDEGEGPAVVLIHGFASSLETWQTVRPALEPGFRTLALDLKGFGWTERPEGDYSPFEQARIVLDLMDRRGIDRAAVVAHSYGGSVALALALEAPERVSRIVLYDAWVYADQVQSMFMWARHRGIGEAMFALFYTERADERLSLAFYNPQIVTQALVDAVERALDRPGTRAAALAAIRGAANDEIESRLGEIDQPVLVLWGRDDVVTPVEYGERLLGDLPDASLKVYGDCGHFPMIEAVVGSNGDLRRFLDDGVGGSGRWDGGEP